MPKRRMLPATSLGPFKNQAGNPTCHSCSGRPVYCLSVTSYRTQIKNTNGLPELPPQGRWYVKINRPILYTQRVSQ